MDLTSNTSFELPSGYGARLDRELDGNLYLQYSGARSCRTFKITDSGSAADVAPCGSVAVAPDGAIWLAAMLGVGEYKNGLLVKRIWPIAPVPCTISNTAVLMTHSINVDERGNVWFLWDARLWRLNARGELSSVKVPAYEGASSMVETRDGSLWLTMPGFLATDLYRFRAF